MFLLPLLLHAPAEMAVSILYLPSIYLPSIYLPSIYPPVVPLQHLVALPGVVVLGAAALLVPARPEDVHLHVPLQYLHIVLPDTVTLCRYRYQ